MVEIKQTQTYDKWYRKLKDKRAKILIASRIERLAWGHMGDVVSIGQEISELRIHYGPGYRLYFMRQNEGPGVRFVLLLCAGTKGTQKRDIGAAKLLAQEIRAK